MTSTSGTVTVEITSWVTRLVGGDGAGRRVFEEPLAPGTTVRSVLAALTARYPELAGALWNGRELGEHLEVLVNDAVLGVEHELDSPLNAGDRIALLPQFSGGMDLPRAVDWSKRDSRTPGIDLYWGPRRPPAPPHAPARAPAVYQRRRGPA